MIYSLCTAIYYAVRNWLSSKQNLKLKSIKPCEYINNPMLSSVRIKSHKVKSPDYNYNKRFVMYTYIFRRE